MGAEDVAAVSEGKRHFGSDAYFIKQRDISLSSDALDRAFEGCRPTCREQLLRIGADTGGGRRRKPNVQAAIRTARDAPIAPSGCLGPGGVHDLSGLAHRRSPFNRS